MGGRALLPYRHPLFDYCYFPFIIDEYLIESLSGVLSLSKLSNIFRAMVVLSGDVLLIILDFLKAQVDHNTLFQCALVSRWLAEPALAILYQLYDSSPAFGGGAEDESFRPRTLDFSRVPSLSMIPRDAAESAATFRKWVLMWRSIILSTSDGETFLPYCDYIRYLDLDDFRELLTHSGFKGPIRE